MNIILQVVRKETKGGHFPIVSRLCTSFVADARVDHLIVGILQDMGMPAFSNLSFLTLLTFVFPVVLKVKACLIIPSQCVPKSSFLSGGNYVIILTCGKLPVLNCLKNGVRNLFFNDYFFFSTALYVGIESLMMRMSVW